MATIKAIILFIFSTSYEIDCAAMSTSFENFTVSLLSPRGHTGIHAHWWRWHAAVHARVDSNCGVYTRAGGNYYYRCPMVEASMVVVLMPVFPVVMAIVIRVSGNTEHR